MADQLKDQLSNAVTTLKNALDINLEKAAAEAKDARQASAKATENREAAQLAKENAERIANDAKENALLVSKAKNKSGHAVNAVNRANEDNTKAGAAIKTATASINSASEAITTFSETMASIYSIASTEGFDKKIKDLSGNAKEAAEAQATKSEEVYWHALQANVELSKSEIQAATDSLVKAQADIVAVETTTATIVSNADAAASAAFQNLTEAEKNELLAADRFDTKESLHQAAEQATRLKWGNGSATSAKKDSSAKK